MRFEISLTKAQWEKLMTMRELLSNSVPRGDWSEVLEYLSDKVIRQKTGNLKTKEQESKVRTASLYQLKKAVLKKHPFCQFKSKDGKVCGSAWHLEADHIKPKWAGGQDTLENLRSLCGSHNRHVYRQQANIRSV